MRLADYLDPDLILLDLPAPGRNEALAQIADRLAEKKLIKDRDDFLAAVHKREVQGCTAIGRCMAIPHARSKTVKRIVVAMARLRDGIDFSAEDGEPVRLIFLIGTPEDRAGEYLKVLGRLSKLLKENDLRKELLKAASATEVLGLLEQAESKLP
ncbi:MAG: PTS sugar transporter subunit IIA [Acidobacteria bacterium]|jgi:fructose-specific phosphotransferase system IIA component|nr:PTS sugar transporter subunit IIA [Acidobacteriota bacterium]